jgi:hypothetical protein
VANEFKKYAEKNKRNKAVQQVVGTRTDGTPILGGVAQYASKGAPNRKQHARLSRRLVAWSLSMDNKNMHGGIQQRKDSGGFHRPGSYSK